MGSKTKIIATLIAGTCLAGYALAAWRLDKWRAAVADYEERIEIANVIRKKNGGATPGTPGDGTYYQNRKHDAMMRERIIDYHSELQKLLEKKPFLLGLNAREQELSVQVRVALGRFRKGSSDRAEASSREYATLREAENLRRRAREPEQMEFTSYPTPPPTPVPLKFITPVPQATPSREQVVSDIERKYGKPAAPP